MLWLFLQNLNGEHIITWAFKPSTQRLLDWCVNLLQSFCLTTPKVATPLLPWLFQWVKVSENRPASSSVVLLSFWWSNMNLCVVFCECRAQIVVHPGEDAGPYVLKFHGPASTGNTH